MSLKTTYANLCTAISFRCWGQRSKFRGHICPTLFNLYKLLYFST